jgi:hypothetical protein
MGVLGSHFRCPGRNSSCRAGLKEIARGEGAHFIWWERGKVRVGFTSQLYRVRIRVRGLGLGFTAQSYRVRVS